MSEKLIVTAEECGDDVLIRFPDEFGVKEGQLFEMVKRPNGVVDLKFAQRDIVE